MWTCSVCHQRADEDGFIGRMHKNDAHNLVALYQTCHDRVHNETVQMHGVAQTSAGKMLEKQIETRDTVQALRKQGKSYKAIADELKPTVYEVKKQFQK